MSWASFLKAGGKAVKWFGKGAGKVIETSGKAILHPQQALKGAGQAVKTATVGAGLGYVGWKKLTTDESVVGIVSDAIIGEENTKKVADTVHGAVDGMKDLKESVTGMGDSVSGTMQKVDDKLSGISGFLSQVSSGNGGEMLGGFLGNLAHGNVSGLGIAGLVLSSFLVFGRFGWMAKIAGAILAMMTIGNNYGREQSPSVQQQRTANTAGEPQRQDIREPEAERIHMSRR